jgi:transcriptional regulator with XRE-family HTH domain
VTTKDAVPQRWLTANQLVAYNISRYRRNLQMTQERLAERLTFFSGKPWSKVTVSAAERSFDGNRVRQFDADDLVALASALQVPLPGFFMPPDDDGESVSYHLKPIRSDRVTSVGGLITLFTVSRDDEGPNIELFGELMQRELASVHGTDFQQDFSGIFDISGVSAPNDPEERQERAVVELERELAQAMRLLRRLLDSVRRDQGPRRGDVDEGGEG